MSKTVRTGFGLLGWPASDILRVCELAQLVSEIGFFFCDRVRSEQVFGRLTVTERQRAVSGTQKTGGLMLEASTAGLDPDVGWKFRFPRSHQVRDCGAEIGIRHAAILRIASQDPRHPG